MKRVLLSLVVPFALVACAGTPAPTPIPPQPQIEPPIAPQPAGKVEVWSIAPRYATCTGVGRMKCMTIARTLGGNPELFYDSIAGFNYQEGYEYQIQVMGTKVANPPADGSSISYKLIKVVNKRKVGGVQN